MFFFRNRVKDKDGKHFVNGQQSPLTPNKCRFILAGFMCKHQQTFVSM